MSNNRSFFFLTIYVLAFILACQKNRKERPKGETESSKTLFTLMHPDSTGLDYYNQLDENKTLNILTYEYLYNGGGIAVGDINNDDLPDVFMVGNTYGGRLFLNQGNLKFKQISESAGIFVPGFSTGVSMVDINSDGYLDIYLCRSMTNNPEHRRNVLFINNGDLTFTDKAAEYGLDDPSFSNYANFFDYDRDGDLDLYLLNHRVDFKDALTIKTYTDKKGMVRRVKDTVVQYVSDKLYRNDGNQSFTDVTDRAGLTNRAFGLSVTISDINHDNWPDIYVANDYADKDHLYINQKDGTFLDELENYFFHTSKNAMGSDIADFNNDGLLDLINLDMIPEDNYRQKQLKGAGAYDLYQMALKYGLTHQVMRNTLQLNNGNGSFSEIGQLAGVSHTDWSWTPLFADFDNDGWKDLFISNGYFRDVTDMDYLKYESNKVLLDEGGVPQVNPFSLVQKIPHNPISNYVFMNNGDLTFENKTKNWGVDTAAISNGAVYSDLDLDGDLDIICNNLNSRAFLFRNNAIDSEENNYLQLKLKGSVLNQSGVGAKIWITTSSGMQYQELTPYRGYLSNVDPIIHFGLGLDRQVNEVKVMWPNGQIELLKNIEANQKVVLEIENAQHDSSAKQKVPKALFGKLAQNRMPEIVHQEDDFVDFKREPLLEHQLSNKGPFLTVGDVNGDSLDDVYFSGSAGIAGILFIQNKNGSFQKKYNAFFNQYYAREDAQSVFFDADGDGDLDLYVVSGGSSFQVGDSLYRDRLYINDGKGNFIIDAKALPNVSVNGTSVVAFDEEGDGDLDLFVGGGVKPGAYPYCEVSQLLINENGNFKLANERLPNNGKLGMISDVKLFDESLLIVGEWMPISFLNKKGSNYEITEIPNSEGWWNCVKVFDLDKDGDLDIVAGNRGDNTFYKVSQEHPATIFAKDFDQNGSVDALPFYYFNDGKQHPRHTLDEVFAQYPSIRRKFPRYNQYSKAGLNDIFTEDELSGSLQLKTRTFKSSVFENLGNGKFKTVDLPNEAQFSETHGIIMTDVNQDGHYDILSSGNNYGVDVEMGRMDASIGSVLLGDGSLKFKHLPANESGFVIKGDSRGIYQISVGTKTQYWILRNNDTPIGFTLQ